ATDRGACFATLLEPHRLFAVHARPGVARKAIDALGQRPVGFSMPAGPQQRAAGLEPEQAIAREFRSQPLELLKRLAVALLAVVEQHERHARVDAVVAGIVGRLLNERQTLFP